MGAADYITSRSVVCFHDIWIYSSLLQLELHICFYFAVTWRRICSNNKWLCFDSLESTVKEFFLGHNWIKITIDLASYFFINNIVSVGGFDSAIEVFEENVIWVNNIAVTYELSYHQMQIFSLWKSSKFDEGIREILSIKSQLAAEWQKFHKFLEDFLVWNYHTYVMCTIFWALLSILPNMLCFGSHDAYA